MSETGATAISAHVEGDEITYRWYGEDAEQRHEQWALTDAKTYDEAVIEVTAPPG